MGGMFYKASFALTWKVDRNKIVCAQWVNNIQTGRPQTRQIHVYIFLMIL